MNDLTFRQIIFLLHKDSSDDAYDALEYFFYEYCSEYLDDEITLLEYLEESMYV